MALKAYVEIRMMMRDGETAEEAENRLYDLLWEGLCCNAEHEVDFWIDRTSGGD